MILIIMTIEKFQYIKNSNLEPKLRERQKKSICIFQSRCGVASELVHWTPDQAVWVRALAGGIDSLHKFE